VRLTPLFLPFLLAAGTAPAGSRAAEFRMPPKLSKREGFYHLETVIRVPLGLEKAVPAARDYAVYKAWALEGINDRSDGGEYKIDFTSLRYLPEAREFHIGMDLNTLFEGSYTLALKVVDELDSDPRRVRVMTEHVGHLVKEVRGEFIAVPLSREEFEIRFKGRARLHWAFYYLIPLRVLAVDVQDRIQIFLANFGRRAARIEAPVRSK